MAELWEFAVLDDNGELHEMPERMARAAIRAGRAEEEQWSLWRRRRVQVGEWSPAGGESA